MDRAPHLRGAGQLPGLHDLLIGHKPIMEHPVAEEDGILNITKHPFGDRLQAPFQASDKVRAYFCAHEHLWE